MRLIVFPAIDLRAGKVVRLRQGDPSLQTEFSDDPVSVALRWQSAGAEWLHVVNLDGALKSATVSDGSAEPALANLKALGAIRAATEMPIEYGGGVRNIDDIAAALQTGATRVILGTVAVENPEVVAASLDRFGAARIVVALDGRQGKVSTHGWQTISQVGVMEMARRLRSIGVERALYTDVERDGMLTGVNAAATASLARASGLAVIASGGVATLDDIRTLAALVQDGIEGVVVGQAIYTGALDLAAAIAEACRASGKV